MDDLSFFVGVIGNVVSVLMFLAPLGTFWRIIKRRSTEEFESLPYVCTLLSSCLWTYYGVTRPGSYLVATVNGFGVVVESVYVSLFFFYAPTKAIRVRTAVTFGILDVGFLGAAITVTRLALQGEARIDAIGFICAGLNIIMYASPLSAMRTVMRRKSVEYMPFMLSFFFFLNGGIWTFYAFLVRDIFLAVPNGAGFLLGTAQLVLYALYRDRKPLKTGVAVTANLPEEGTHQPLITPPSSV